eukprot:s79_g5.t1
MALVLLSNSGRGALKIASTNGLCVIDTNNLPVQKPTIGVLETLPKSTLFEMATYVRNDLKKKMNKNDLAIIVDENWEAITRCFCVDNGLISVYGTIEEKTQRVIPPTTSLSIQEFKGDLNSKVNRPYFVKLVVPMEGSSIGLGFHFDDKMTGCDIFTTFNEVFQMNIDEGNCHLVLGSSCMPVYETIHSYVMCSSQSLTLLPKLKGGVLMRSHLKPEQALKALKEKTLKLVKKPSTPENFQSPEQIQSFITGLRASIDDALVLKSRGIPLIKTSLKTLSEADVKELQSIMEYKKSGRRETSIEKIMKVFGMIYPKCFELNDAVLAITAFHGEMTEVFIGWWVDEYATVSNGEAFFDNEKFRNDLLDELKRREIVRQQSLPSVEQGQGGNCVLM